MKQKNLFRFARWTAALALMLTAVCVCGTSLAAVRRPLPKLALNVRARILYLGSGGEKTELQLQTNGMERKTAQTQYYWLSSNPRVARVNEKGLVVPMAVGRARIVYLVVEGRSRQYALCDIAVLPVVPTSVSFQSLKSTVSVGERMKLQAAVYPANALDKRVCYLSSNPSVLWVNTAGDLVARKPGTAVLYCVTLSGRRIAAVRVGVTQNFNGITYRVYAIGNANYLGDEKLPGCLNDVAMVAKAFQSASFSGQKASVYARANLTGSGIRSLLSAMSSNGADENDVSVFYFSGHGMSGGNYNGALCGVDWDLVSVNEVQRYLDRVPGKVVVMLDCCLSGQYIHSKAAAASAQSFNQAFCSALVNGPAASKALTDSRQRNKYKIITASAPMQPSYISNDRSDACSVFTDYLALALGVDCYDGVQSRMYGDLNGDTVVTLNELFAYVNAKVNAYVRRYPALRQTTMVWPAGDVSPVIARN